MVVQKPIKATKVIIPGITKTQPKGKGKAASGGLPKLFAAKGSPAPQATHQAQKGGGWKGKSTGKGSSWQGDDAWQGQAEPDIAGMMEEAILTTLLNEGWALGMGMGNGGSWGNGGNSWGGNFKIDKSGGELGEFIGVIKTFMDRKNFGFIECAEAGQGDIFLHGDQKKMYQVGHTVKFDCVLNKDGKAVAINLKSGLK